MAKDIQQQILELLGMMDYLANETPEQRQWRVDAEIAQQRKRIAQRNARFQKMLGFTTDIQSVRIDKLETVGMKVVKAWQNRRSGKICVMLQKDGVFNQKTHRMGTKLAMVYPDGVWMEAFGKISIQEDKLV